MNCPKTRIKQVALMITTIIGIFIVLFLSASYCLMNKKASDNFQKELNNKEFNGYKVVVQIAKDSKIKSFYKDSGYKQLQNLLDTKYGYYVENDPHSSGNSQIKAITKDKAIIYIALKYSKEEIAYFLTTPKLLFKKLDKNNIWIETGLDNRYIKKADLTVDNDKWGVYIKFDEQGKEKLAQITQELTGKQLGMFFADELLTAPTINEQITTGAAQISLNDGSYEVANNLKIAIQQRLDLDVIEIQESNRR